MPTLRCEAHLRLHRLHTLPLLVLLTGETVSEDDEGAEDDGVDEGS